MLPLDPPHLTPAHSQLTARLPARDSRPSVRPPTQGQPCILSTQRHVSPAVSPSRVPRFLFSSSLRFIAVSPIKKETKPSPDPMASLGSGPWLCSPCTAISWKFLSSQMNQISLLPFSVETVPSRPLPPALLQSGSYPGLQPLHRQI